MGILTQDLPSPRREFGGIDRVATAVSLRQTGLRHRFRRRWWVALLGILGTAGLCLMALSAVPASYKAKADVLLTPPGTVTTSVPNPNPYLDLGGLAPLADVISQAMTSSSLVTQLDREGLIGTYSVIRDVTTDAPVLTVTASGKSPSSVLKNLRLVVAAISPQLTRLQTAESVPAKDWVTATIVAEDTTATASRKSQTRAVLVAGVAGLFATALAVSVIDTLLLRRRPSRTEKATAPDKANLHESASRAKARSRMLAGRRDGSAASDADALSHPQEAKRNPAAGLAPRSLEPAADIAPPPPRSRRADALSHPQEAKRNPAAGLAPKSLEPAADVAPSPPRSRRARLHRKTVPNGSKPAEHDPSTQFGAPAP
jgi:hypothetical protein